MMIMLRIVVMITETNTRWNECEELKGWMSGRLLWAMTGERELQYKHKAVCTF
jgi:hypothetical protein